MQDLSLENHHVILNFKYGIKYAELTKIAVDFDKYLTDRKLDKNRTDFDKFLRANFPKYFKESINSILYDISKKEADSTTIKKIEIKQDEIKKIINFKYIDAKRLVSNDAETVLSRLSYKFYEKKKECVPQESPPSGASSTSDDEQILLNLESQVNDTDKNLSEIYEVFFKPITDKAKRFGGIKPGEVNLDLVSALKYESLLSNNISVMYQEQEHRLPENFNGLGYLNLLSIIFEIESLLHDFKTPKIKATSCADINLLFIEEPEAHTHPQMQYIFIKNIKKILDSVDN